MKKVAIIGTGYVGLATAAILSNTDIKVYTVDIDEDKIDIIKEGRSYFFETGLDEFVKKGVESGNLVPTTEYEEAIRESDVVFSCVGTPDKADGSSDLKYIYQVAEEVAKQCANSDKEEIIFVQKSTVPVGTGEKLVEFMKDVNSELKVNYVSNPEFLREGAAVFDTLNIDRLVIGSDNSESAEKVKGIFRKVFDLAQELDHSEYSEYANAYHDKLEALNEADFDDKVFVMDIKSAELVKVTANAFLALKISFANSIAKLSDKAGSNISEVMDGVGADPRIGRSFLYAGLGWGGGCFPKDVSGLIATANEHGVDLPIMDAAVLENAEMVGFVADKVVDLTPEHGKVAVLGLSFKPGTSDVRKSPAIRLANRLIDEGFEVVAYDPQAMEEAEEFLSDVVVLKDDIDSALDGVDAVVIATDWNVFKGYDWDKGKGLMSGDVVVDGRNCLDSERVRGAGLRYVGVGQ